MRLVLDANILFSAPIRDSVTRRLLKNRFLQIVAPDYLFEELEKHRAEIQSKSGLSYQDFQRALEALSTLIEKTQVQQIQSFFSQALAFAPDPADTPYLALCLAQQIPLWSNDKRLKQQKRVAVYTTPEVQELLENQ
jgi:predicted nucleic acid-binding protein